MKKVSFIRTRIRSNINKKHSVCLSLFIMLSMLFFMILIYLPSLTYAASLSVTKAEIFYNNVLRGGYAEDILYVSSDTEFDVPLEYELLGDIASWISIESITGDNATVDNITGNNVSLYVSRNRVELLKIIIQPPEDAAAGNYTGSVRLITGTINKPEGPYGSQLQAAFLIRIKVSVTGEQILSCNFGGLSIPDIEIGEPIRYSFTVQNSGNVRVRPNISIDIWNQDQSRIVKSISNKYAIDVLPTTSKVFIGESSNNLRIGQYWAYASVVPCGKSEIVSFSVLEKGQIADSGELLRIENKPWASTGEIVPINPVFKNLGQRVVSAKFKGIITLDNKIVTNIDSDFYDVAPGEVVNLTVFFTPKKKGQYYISGRVLYNNKLTFEKSSILNVNEGKDITEFNMFYVFIIIIIIIIILLLFLIIRKKRKRLRRNLPYRI
ncbi:MAG: hypothetical protein KatS3mg002_1212 [Candidatus Woesearchaeota archaeon]|nr:MAG: hypothetical protein KatS3mg002_1212 [Candidatus Woesearchaeota archaeon]